MRVADDPRGFAFGRDGYPLTFVLRARGRLSRASRKLAHRLGDLGVKRPYVISSRYGAPLVESLPAVHLERAPSACSETAARRLADRLMASGADAAVFVGGGRVLDVGKVAATFAGIPMIGIPTQLSHDGIASPVAILAERGHKRTIQVAPPAAIFLSLPTLAEAPLDSFKAGVGDLLSNEYALHDWVVAQAAGRDIVLPDAYSASLESLHLVESLLERDPVESSQDPVALGLLGVALVNSGLAMLVAGSSRPASGAEHKVSHAIDTLLGGRALHGAQVAFGCIVSAYLQGQDVDALRHRLDILGLPNKPADLGLTRAELRAVLLTAAQARPERYTILDEYVIDESTVDVLIEEIWPELRFSPGADEETLIA